MITLIIFSADTLGALPSLPTESGNEITLPSGPSQQQDTPSSSSASDLHLSGLLSFHNIFCILLALVVSPTTQWNDLRYRTVVIYHKCSINPPI